MDDRAGAMLSGYPERRSISHLTNGCRASEQELTMVGGS